ncbi:MAG TPA: PQQ-binding-like beta-propeller repeat protein [Gemmataceae bacterium]|jgi:outer membrane protein assembly factor BamB
MICRRILRRLFLVLLLLLAAPARGEEKQALVLSGESRAASLRLVEARKRLEGRKWSEAIEELQSILNTFGNDLVSIGPNHSVRVSRLCQIQLASLPAEALNLYRQRYENQAQKKLQQAQAERDVLQLRKIAEDSFCTRAAEKAIDLLGDLAFERGRFEEAEEWWRLLAPLPDARRDAGTRGLALVYPNATLDAARVQAKQLLARLFQGADSEWMSALESYGQRYAKVEGSLAGQKGRYVDLLQKLVEERKKQGHSEPEIWPTFGGSPSRGTPVPAPEDILSRLGELCGRRPKWTFNLEQRNRQALPSSNPISGVTAAVNASQARTLAFEPVIVGHRVLVADARYVTAFDLRTGQSEEWYDVARDNGGVRPNLKLPAPPDLRYTLTVADGHAYVRLGAQDIGIEAPAPQPPRRFGAPAGRDNETFLACLSLQADDKGGHFRGHIRGIAHENCLFEGAPLVAGGLIWIASTRYNGNRCFTAIECYTADESSSPPLRWRCDVCETSDVKIGEPRYRHHLLTLAGTQIVYCTHNGAVVAVDAVSGRRNWAIRYPRRTSEETTELRDLAPVLFAAGRLYVAPADSNTLLCLDPATGRTLWELERLRVVHLLGVGQGRLIFTTPTGLRAVRADNGSPAWSVPDSGGGLTPAGRGLLIGDLVLFPTAQPRDPGSPFRESVVYALRQSDGRPADDPAKLHRLPAGNLAYANGCLVVADRQTLSVFVPERLELDRRKTEAQREPNSAAALLQLARAEADAALDDAALQTLRRVEDLLRRQPDTSAAKKLLAQSLIVKQNELLAMAQRAAQEKRWSDAENALAQAAAIPLSPRYRLHALLRAAQIWQDVKQADRAAAVWESIRAKESLRTIPMIDRQGRPLSMHIRDRRDAGPTALAYGSRLNSAPSLPLFRTWHVRLGDGEWILDGWRRCDPEFLLTGSTDGRLNCRLTSTGEIHWTHRLPFTPCWVGCHADTILAAGEQGVVCLQREKGQPLWYVSAPETGHYPRAPCDEVRIVLDPQPPRPLTDFRLVAGRLFFLQNQRRLFALNAETGAVLWDRWAPDGPLLLPFPSGCFSPCYYAGSETVLIQTPGRRWLLDAATGRQIHEAADSPELWRQPPVELDARTLCLAPEYRHLVLLDARTGQCLWTHRAANVTTLSGELPSVKGSGNLLLCVQPANIGFFLQRLDRASGKGVWPRPRLLAAKTLESGTWTFDTDAIYIIEDRLLVARNPADGAILWRQPLLGEDGHVRRVGDYLAVCPKGSRSETRFRFRSLVGTVQWDLGPLLAPEAICPLSLYDPKSGQLVQRLNFRIESSVRTAPAKRRIQEEGERAWFVRTSSLLASPDGPVICLDTPRPFVAIGSELWGLVANGRR